MSVGGRVEVPLDRTEPPASLWGGGAPAACWGGGGGQIHAVEAGMTLYLAPNSKRGTGRDLRERGSVRPARELRDWDQLGFAVHQLVKLRQ